MQLNEADINKLLKSCTGCVVYITITYVHYEAVAKVVGCSVNRSILKLSWQTRFCVLRMENGCDFRILMKTYPLVCMCVCVLVCACACLFVRLFACVLVCLCAAKHTSLVGVYIEGKKFETRR